MNHMGFQPPGAFITHLIKCGFKRYGPINTIDDFEIHNLDLTSLNLDVGILVPFFVPKRLSGYKVVNSEELGKVLPDLIKVTQSLQKKFVVLTVGGKLMGIEKRLIEDLGSLSIAIMDRSTIDGVLDTNDRNAKAKLLSTALVKFLGLEALSPYVSGRPAIGGRFFGRSSLVKRIVPSAGNFTIVGNRRIGKTSLLKEIKERLKLQNVRTAEVYGGTCRSTSDVVYKLLQSLEKSREAERVSWEPQRAKNLAAYIHSIPDTEKRPVAVFIDEVDRILEFDAKQNNELLHLLRETFEGHHFCRIFLAGFRKVMEAKQSISAPVFNFTNFIELPLFDREETFEMVTKPLERLGIAVSDTDLPEAIYAETGGHPELIQIHCAEIVRFMQAHRRVPTGADLLTGVFNTGEYKQKVLGTFLSNTNPHEELLCYLLMSDAEKTGRTVDYYFEPHDVNRVLTTVDIRIGVRDIAAIITNLKVSGIVSQVVSTREQYRFCAPKLVDYSMGLNLDFCIEKALEEINDQLENAVEAKDHKRRARAAIFEVPAEHEQIKIKTPAEEQKPRVVERAESVIRIKSLVNQVKYIYLMPQGGVIVTEAEGTTTLAGAIDPVTVDDLNNRCLEIVDRWTSRGIYEQRLRGIGKQLSDALRLGVPDLSRHLIPDSDRSQTVIVTNAEGLKIPFELLPLEKSHLATSAALTRRLINYRLPSNVRSSFHQLITSLGDTTEPLRVLLVASDPHATIQGAAGELSAVRDHIEVGCQQMGLTVEFVEILPPDATPKRLEVELVYNRPFHLLHFTGHGNHYSEEPDASGMVLLGDDGEPEIVTCRRLSRWLEGTNLWLAYMSSCHSSAASGSGLGLSQKYVGLIEAIVAAGVPNVVGFRWLVSDRSAFYLADEFYRQVFKVQLEKNLNLAMLEARRAVELRPDFFDAWASSMLLTQYS